MPCWLLGASTMPAEVLRYTRPPRELVHPSRQPASTSTSPRGGSSSNNDSGHQPLQQQPQLTSTMMGESALPGSSPDFTMSMLPPSHTRTPSRISSSVHPARPSPARPPALLLLLLLAVLTAAAQWGFPGARAASCPADLCSCPEKRTIMCSKRHLDHVPRFDEGPNDLLDLTERLDLSRNEIFSVPPFAFNTLHVRAIDLSYNMLMGISPRAFTGLEDSLETLSLYQAGLKVIHWGVFANLHLLRALDLGKNELFAIPKGLFDGLRNLESLTLTWNPIDSISAGMFRHLNNLHRLNLMGNVITHIEPGAFHDLRSLLELNLKSNRITALEKRLFQGMEHLVKLELDNNRIRTIESRAFLVLPQLRYLALSHNNLTVVEGTTFLGASGLQELHIDFNALRNISWTAFSRLPHLRLLKLDGNKLRYVNGCMFDTMLRVQQVGLADNPITCDCSLSTIKHLKKRGATVTGSCQLPEAFKDKALMDLEFSMCSKTNCSKQSVSAASSPGNSLQPAPRFSAGKKSKHRTDGSYNSGL